MPANPSDPCPRCGKQLKETRGIEVKVHGEGGLPGLVATRVEMMQLIISGRMIL